MHYFLIVTHNHSPFIEKAVESIAEQYDSPSHFGQEARILIVDDASLDNTQTVLDRLRATHPNVRTHYNSVSQGLGRNRNLLLDWMNAQALPANSLVTFLDGDDLLASDCLRHRKTLFKQDPDLQVVGGQMHLFYMDGAPSHVVDTFSLDPDIQAIASLFENHFLAANATFKADVFHDPKVRFPDLEKHEDWLFFLSHELYKRHTPEITRLYRRHSSTVIDSHMDPLKLRSVRHTAHQLWAMKIGCYLSEDECDLLDLVSYLSFRLKMSATTITRARCQMVWFKPLQEQAYALSHWAELRADLRKLFKKLLARNAHVPAYHPLKLKLFLEGMLKLADQEVMAATTSHVGARAKQCA